MKLLSILFSRLLDAGDVLMEAASALWRVSLRGAFAADAKSYRGVRFLPLSAKDVLVQEIALNAADHGEAKKAVLLDAERLLPLAPEALAFDIVGPIDQGGELRSRPERTFLLGIIRKDALDRLRVEAPLLRRGAIEAFVHSPPSHPERALLFEDDAGRGRRRRRRGVLMIALVIFAVTANDALRAGGALFERTLAKADTERITVERRIRLAERQLELANARRQSLAANQAPRLAVLSSAIERLARHQPADAATSQLSLTERMLAFEGRAFEPDAAELAWRRAFETSELSFAAADGEPPRTFEARLSLTEAPP